MTDPQPPYISGMAAIHSILHSDRLGIHGWPSDLWQQEQRIALFQKCFFDAEELLKLICEDFNVNPPAEERKDRDDPIPTHTELWLSMYEAAQSLTRADLLERLSLLRIDCTTKKTIESLQPTLTLVRLILDDVKKRDDEVNDKFPDSIEWGPDVTDEIANSARYQKWRRSYPVLRDVMGYLYAALERIYDWIVHKIHDVELTETAGTLKKGNEKSVAGKTGKK